MSQPNEPDIMGRWMLLGIIGFVGLCILIFGLVQLFNGQRIAGSLIIFIALVDLLLLVWLRKKV